MLTQIQLPPHPQLLLVDDSPVNLDILTHHLRDKDYVCVTAPSGMRAWELLDKEPDRFYAVVLDRMMPEMDGIEVLKRMKAHPVLSQVPVIMQTAAGTQQQILEGLQAGAYYYLVKPYDKATLLAIVDAAVRDHSNYLEIRHDLRRTTATMRLLESATFTFKSPDEAKNMATLLAHAYPDPNRVVTGILELTLNAVEHGNLEIGYAQKTQLIEEDKLDEEIRRRLSDPLYASRVVTAHFARHPTKLSLQISDQGKGFDWKKYLDFDPDRAFDTHGRGIAMANKLSFDQIEYRGTGNRVITVLDLIPVPEELVA
ncbi:MAG: response regulator [Nitrospira sp.]|nr:response regulator [Nitrospira sp.]